MSIYLLLYSYPYTVQGDILSGCIAVANYWARLSNTMANNASCDTFHSLTSILQKIEVSPNTSSGHEPELDSDSPMIPINSELSDIQKGNMIGAVLATTVVKKSSLLAYLKHHRGTSGRDVVNEISTAFNLLL